MQKNCNQISVQKVAAIGVLGLTYIASFCFGRLVGKQLLPTPAKIIISVVGGAVIGITGGEIAKKLLENDNPVETISKFNESLCEIVINDPETD